MKLPYLHAMRKALPYTLIFGFFLIGDGFAASFTDGNEDRGQRIFESTCIYCHNMDEELSAVGAPGLGLIVARRTFEWLDQYLANPKEFAKRDDVARSLMAGKSDDLIMPALPVMQRARSRADVIAYLSTLK